MQRLIEESIEYRRLLSVMDVPLIIQYIPIETIKDIIQECDVEEKRLRRLPMWLAVLICIVRGIFAKESISSAFARLSFIPCLKNNYDLSRLPDKSALCLARYRLGVRPLVMLFQRICHPLATPRTPGAYVFGYRLVAIDTTFEVVADSERNASYFGRHATKKGKSNGAFPLCQAIYLCECATRVIFDAAIMPFRSDHHQYCKRMLRSVKAEMLVMLDSGLLEFATLKALSNKGAQFILPAKASMKLTPIRYFYDGSYLAWMRSWKTSKRSDDKRLLVRVIPYTLDDTIRNPEGKTYRMITSLLEPSLCPAKKIINTYHQRWEIEITIDEIDTHQRLPRTPFRSQKPVGVIQEFYALLLAYFIIGCIRYESAEEFDLSPQQLSFVNSLRLIEHILPITQLLDEVAKLRQLIHQWQLYFRLSPRDNRINPRVVKRKMSKFRRKKPTDRSEYVPDFLAVVRLLQPA